MNSRPVINEENNKTAPVSESLPILIFAGILFYLMYGIVLADIRDVMSDYNGHVYVYLATFTGESMLKGWMMAPYFLWHTVVLFFNKILFLPIDISAALSSCAFLMASYFITVFMINRWCRHKAISCRPSVCGFLSFSLTVLQPIWISFLDAGTSRTVGSFSINPLYNPTQMAARPFALLCIMLLIDLWHLQDRDFEGADSSEGTIFFKAGQQKLLILLALFLFLSAVAKPVFAEMFIPAVGIMMLFRQFRHIFLKDRKGKQYFTKALLPTFCAAIPCISCILMQFLIYFIFGGSYATNGGFIITGFLETWSFFSENVALSILFMISFPILIIVGDSRNFLKSSSGQLGIVCSVIGFLEAALLGEGGDKLYHGDFMWPMLFGMLILWISALLHFLHMDRIAKSTVSRAIVTAGWILMIIHLFFGLQYISAVIGWNFFIF